MKYFGTDGIRGVVNKELNYDLFYKIGKSLAQYLIQNNKTLKVVIAKDTRVSGDLVCYGVACGLCDFGVTCEIAGIMPTGGLSYLASKFNFGAGLMITASHNAPELNGIKIFNDKGFKLSVSDEEVIEKNIDKVFDKPFIKGKIYTNNKLVDYYTDYLTHEIGCNLSGFNIAVDCAYGSNYKIAQDVLKKLNANVICINNFDKGEKINVDCGALNVTKLREEVLSHSCDFGFAFDGDADRLVVVLSDGRVLSGDDIIFVLACYMLKANKLNSRVVVGTIMTNSGMEQSLNKLGIELKRTDVGDKLVIEELNNNNYSLGGESSGHICVLGLNTSCDALLNALLLLKIVITENIDLNEFLLKLKKVPQVIKSVQVDKQVRSGFDKNTEFKNKVLELEKTHNVRLVVRPSGTEPVFRIMAEGTEVNCNKAILDVEKLLIDKNEV